MKIGVIGGSGFIGSRLCANLLSEGVEVLNYDKRAPDTGRFPIEIKTFIGDVRDLKTLDGWMKGFDVIILLAAEHADDVNPVSLYYDVNVDGAKNVCAAARNNGVKRLIFTSSVAVYGLNAPEATENTKPSPFNDYGKSKLQAEDILKEWANSEIDNGLTVVRPCVVFGEGNRGNVYNLMKQIYNGKFVSIGRGENKKSMAYIENIVKFLSLCKEYGTGTRIFNYADKPDLSVADLVSVICDEMKCNKPIITLPYWLGICIGYIFDFLSTVSKRKYSISSERIKKLCADTSVDTRKLEALGYRRAFTLEAGIRRMVKSDFDATSC